MGKHEAAAEAVLAAPSARAALRVRDNRGRTALMHAVMLVPAVLPSSSASSRRARRPPSATRSASRR